MYVFACVRVCVCVCACDCARVWLLVRTAAHAQVAAMLVKEIRDRSSSSDEGLTQKEIMEWYNQYSQHPTSTRKVSVSTREYPLLSPL